MKIPISQYDSKRDYPEDTVFVWEDSERELKIPSFLKESRQPIDAGGQEEKEK